MKVLRFLYTNLKDRRKIFWFVFITAMLDGYLNYSVQLSLSRLSTNSPAHNESTIVMACLFLMAALFTSYIIRRYGEMMALTTSESVRTQLIGRLVNVPLLNLFEHHSGYVLSLVNRVADTLQPVLFNLYWWAARSIVFTTLLFLLILKQSPVIFIVDFGVVVLFVMLSQVLSSYMIIFNKDVNHTKSTFMSVFADFAANIATVKRLHISDFMQKRINAEMNLVVGSVNRQQEFHAIRWFMLHAVYALLFAITFGFLVWQLNAGVITVGSFIVFIALFYSLRGDLNQLAENLKVYNELGGYIEQIDGVLSVKLDQTRNAKTKNPDSLIEIQGLQFRYPETKTVITVPALVVQKNEVICIFGPSGQGKSTLLHLIAGLLVQDAGTIDRGIDLHNVAVVSQEIELFNTTLRENLTLGLDIPDSKIRNMLKELDLLKVVESRAEGLDVVIGEKGLRLSAGQKQRVNLARAFFQNRALYLLDEPISHLDPKTTYKVISFLRKHLKGKTAIIVSHQKEVLQLATRVYEMRRRSLR
ncbi:ABC transporter ATP-binding protein, partial [Candidatus Woesebacteria bacterium]|nr:ABC transporter ATP-binding protein [Candidatus Woesebacteria bacterium]